MSEARVMRGWFGIALYEPKIEANLGGVVRSAHVFGAAFVALIGQRYKHLSSDTTMAHRSLPILYFRDWRLFTETMAHYPIVTVECGTGIALQEFQHPQQAIYVLGGEDRTLPVRGDCAVHLDTKYCLNLASCASIVMYAHSTQIRQAGQAQAKEKR
jgi:tRNA(Leu) C34 or U34 (ribose-2'-O)-methylase TrmL